MQLKNEFTDEEEEEHPISLEIIGAMRLKKAKTYWGKLKQFFYCKKLCGSCRSNRNGKNGPSKDDKDRKEFDEEKPVPLISPEAIKDDRHHSNSDVDVSKEKEEKDKDQEGGRAGKRGKRRRKRGDVEKPRAGVV